LVFSLLASLIGTTYIMAFEPEISSKDQLKRPVLTAKGISG